MLYSYAYDDCRDHMCSVSSLCVKHPCGLYYDNRIALVRARPGDMWGRQGPWI